MKTTQILEVLRTAEAKEIDGNRCFIVSLSDFHEIVESVDIEFFSDSLRRKNGYENIEFRMSSADEHAYYICAKAEPVLDILWKKSQ